MNKNKPYKTTTNNTNNNRNELKTIQNNNTYEQQ